VVILVIFNIDQLITGLTRIILGEAKIPQLFEATSNF